MQNNSLHFDWNDRLVGAHSWINLNKYSYKRFHMSRIIYVVKWSKVNGVTKVTVLQQLSKLMFCMSLPNLIILSFWTTKKNVNPRKLIDGMAMNTIKRASDFLRIRMNDQRRVDKEVQGYSNVFDILLSAVVKKEINNHPEKGSSSNIWMNIFTKGKEQFASFKRQMVFFWRYIRNLLIIRNGM